MPMTTWIMHSPWLDTRKKLRTIFIALGKNRVLPLADSHKIFLSPLPLLELLMVSKML